MLTLIAITTLFGIALSVLNVFGSVDQLPFGIEDFLITSVHNWNAFLVDWWPLRPVWYAFLADLVLLLSIAVIKVFFGSRFHHVGNVQ